MQGGKIKELRFSCFLKPSLAKSSDNFSKEKSTAVKHLLCFCACFHSLEKNEMVSDSSNAIFFSIFFFEFNH